VNLDPDAARFEIKFVGPDRLHDVVEWWIRVHPAGFVEPYPQRRVSNLYFDTYAYGAYEQNLMGSSVRQKLRLRWYGESHQPEQASLEVKLRRNRLGWKLSHPVKALPLEGVRWSEVRRKLRAQLPDPPRLWIDANPFPILINRYERRYFLSSDRRVRLTLDWDQRTFDQRGSTLPNLCRPAPVPRVVVVELKFDPEDRRRVVEIVQGLPLRVSRYSKYIVGVQAIAYT
jgi:hypothetical protein